MTTMVSTVAAVSEPSVAVAVNPDADAPTLTVSDTSGHVWITKLSFTSCLHCGIMKRKNRDNGVCAGPNRKH